MSFIESLLSESSPISSLRLMSILSLIAATAIAGYGVYVGKDLTGLAALCATFIVPAFGAKVSQKLLEKTSNPS